jgi:hypothetical protein
MCSIFNFKKCVAKVIKATNNLQNSEGKIIVALVQIKNRA